MRTYKGALMFGVYVVLAVLLSGPGIHAEACTNQETSPVDEVITQGDDKTFQCPQGGEIECPEWRQVRPRHREHCDQAYEAPCSCCKVWVYWIKRHTMKCDHVAGENKCVEDQLLFQLPLTRGLIVKCEGYHVNPDTGQVTCSENAECTDQSVDPPPGP